MPIHDWTRIAPGIFHDFRHSWIVTINRYLNAVLLPDEYYALMEQRAGAIGPDVLTLETLNDASADEQSAYSAEGSDVGVAVETAPPKVSFTAEAEFLVTRQNRVAIRHTSDHRIVAVIEIVSPGNKAGQFQFDQFVRKACEFITEGVRLLILDLFPPTPRKGIENQQVNPMFQEFAGLADEGIDRVVAGFIPRRNNLNLRHDSIAADVPDDNGTFLSEIKLRTCF